MSPTQIEVMSWMVHGWEAFCHDGRMVSINGKVVCRVATMVALERKGLVIKTRSYMWVAKKWVKEDDT